MLARLQLTLLLLAVLLLSALLSWVVLYWEPSERVDEGGHTLTGLAELPAGGDFSLTHGEDRFHLATLRGQVVLVYFGYSTCPDLCPSSLAVIAQALRRLEGAADGTVAGLFVSVDPQRDTPQRLAEYAGFFHPAIRGVSGEAEEVAQAAALYGVAWRRVESDSALGYLVDHSSNTYLIDAQGSLHTVFPHGATTEELVAAVEALLMKGE